MSFAPGPGARAHRCGRPRYCGTSDGRHTTPTSRPSPFRTGPAEALRSAEPAAASRSTSPARTRTRPLPMSEESAGSPDGAPIHRTAIPRRARGSAAQVGRPCATRLTVENPASDRARTARTAKGRPATAVSDPGPVVTAALSTAPNGPPPPVSPAGDASRVPLVAEVTVDQDDGPVRGTRELRAVRHQEHRRAAAPAPRPELGKEHGRVLRVQVPGGLVGQDDGGVVQHGPAEGDALLLATRERGRKLLGPLPDPEPLEEIARRRLGSRAARGPRTAPRAGRSRGR